MTHRLALALLLALVLAPAGLRKTLETPAPRPPCSPSGRGVPPRHWLGCAADPGLPEARAMLDIPVIGAGSATAAAALAFGGRVGVLGLKHSVPGPISDALGDRMLLIDGPESVETPEGFLLPTGIFDVLAAAHMLVDAGADVILEASTGLTSIGMADVLRRRLGIPVIDPVTAAGSMLVSAVASRELQTV